jgi:hypothetical protein
VLFGESRLSRGDVGGVRCDVDWYICCLMGVFMAVELLKFGVGGGVLKARLTRDGRRGVDIVTVSVVSVMG